MNRKILTAKDVRFFRVLHVDNCPAAELFPFVQCDCPREYGTEADYIEGMKQVEQRNAATRAAQDAIRKARE